MNFSVPTNPCIGSGFLKLPWHSSCPTSAVFQDPLIVFETHVEVRMLYLFGMWAEVANIINQPQAVAYGDEDGKPRPSTPRKVH